MKVLILSNTAGMGHNATGLAIRDYLISLGAKADMIDAYEYINTILSEAVSKGYLISTAYTPKMYGRAYRIAEQREKSTSKNSITHIINSVLSGKLFEFVKDYDPDVIVCTHVFSALLANAMKKKGEINSKIISIVTDFTIHPFWQEVDCSDYFVMASELLEYSAKIRGMDTNKLLPLGIPIHPKFSSKIDKHDARCRLSISPNKNTVLVMSGSMGYGNLEEQLKKIDNLEFDLQTIVVCGNNKRSFDKINSMTFKKDVYNFGYVDNIEIMMDASDIIVTKPGGLTSSEALAKGLPMVMVNPIPGQEERNTEFLLNNGLALKVSNTFGIDEALYYLYKDPTRIEIMRKNIINISKPSATKDLCEFIMTLKV